MNIHDELSFEIYKGEEFLIPAIKKIMEDVDWMTVPVVADVEITHTNWAEKEDV
jgi:DNA polymerase I-like protein with 3'-5' exonuclease and polymerase domains